MINREYKYSENNENYKKKLEIMLYGFSCF